ncbi:MAG: hypothetical protein DMG08_21915 [Acidobacteria bacterium]|nr:MAG: hypothetical protein DMG08_21915 [Acidobacteriota bacterium]
MPENLVRRRPVSPQSEEGPGFFFTTEPQVVRKNRSAGVSPASEPRQLLLGQHDLCRLEAGDTFFLTTTEDAEIHGGTEKSPH